MISQFEIARHQIGGNNPCLIIGEVAQAHDGSLGLAHAFIDVIADAGADAVKFQTHIAHAESSPQEPFRVKFSYQDKTRYEYWERMEFSLEQWQGLADHTHQRGLLFLSSPFSEEAVDLLNHIGMPAWKIASGEVSNPILLEKMFATGKPILLSTGMSSLAEVDRVVNIIREKKLPFAVLQCTSKYPSKPEDLGLNVISTYKERYGVPVGFSDHSGKVFSGLAAVTLGAAILEVHVTMSREMFGPDVPVSLTPSELKELVDGTRFIEQALHHPINKDEFVEGMQTMRTTFGRSLVALHDLKAGQILQRKDLTARKPGTGIPAERLEEVVGKILIRDISANEFLKTSDLKND